MRAHVKVSGNIIDAKGKPLAGIAIHFLPAENMESFKEGKHGLDYPLAISKKDGSFELNMSRAEGARPGKYCVMLAGLSNEQKQTIPQKYQDPDSPFEVTIPNDDVKGMLLRFE